MSIAKALAYTAFVAAIPLFLIGTNVRVLVNTPLLYSYGFDQYEIASATGIKRDELLSAGRQIRDYFNNEERWLDAVVRIHGEKYSLYNDNEILHMWDVKVLIRTLYNVQFAAGLFFLLFIPVGLAIRPRAFPRTLLKLTGWGAALTLAIVGITGLLSLTGFSQTFYAFHVIAFTNDLWMLDPTRDFLIMMFPQGFFFDATMVLVALTVIQAFWLLCLSTFALKVFSASFFFRVTVVQTLWAIAVSIFILRVFPDGFFFEAMLIIVAASGVQALVSLAVWRRSSKKGDQKPATRDRTESRSRATVSERPRRARERQADATRGSERTESWVDKAMLGYYMVEAVFIALMPIIQQWRENRRVASSSVDAAA